MSNPEAILKLGIEAAREGDREQARSLFTLLTREEPDNVQGWLWLAGVAEGPDQRRIALEEALRIEPDNEMAVKGLQAMGVDVDALIQSRSPMAVAVGAPEMVVPVASYAPLARDLTDEERYAAELDAAFDDYDAPAPPANTAGRVTADDMINDDPPPVTNARGRGRPVAARQPSYRRMNRTVDDDDDDTVVASSGPSPMLRWLLGAIAALVVLFTILYFVSQPSTQVATGPTVIPAGTLTMGGSGVNAIPTAGPLDPLATIDPNAPIATIDSAAPVTTIDPNTPVATVDPNAPVATIDPTAPVATVDPVVPAATAAVVPPTGVVAPEQAQPAIIAAGTNATYEGWEYTLFPNVQHAAIGNTIGNLRANGQYVVVLVVIRNNTGSAQVVPADFFVLKDDQGRVYNVAADAANAYVVRGVNADLGLADQVSSNNVPTSIPLIFDVPAGASNLVLFARPNPAQGWQAVTAVR